MQGLVHQRVGTGLLVLEGSSRELERDHRVHQPLLRPVVQVAYDPSALLVGGGEDARPRRAHLLQADPLDVAPAQLVLQPQALLGLLGA
jgi:hypothetical protein